MTNSEQHVVRHTSAVGVMHKIVNVLGLGVIAATAACVTIYGVAVMLTAWHHFMG